MTDDAKAAGFLEAGGFPLDRIVGVVARVRSVPVAGRLGWILVATSLVLRLLADVTWTGLALTYAPRFPSPPRGTPCTSRTT